MSRRIDLTGKRFGALVVLRPAAGDERQYGRPTWICRCDCGKECAVLGDYLRRGIRTSCGCRAGVAAKRRGKPENIEHKDYTGITFGELTGVRRLGCDRWLWRCSCGREKAIRPSLVQTGEIVSCGHVLRETARKKITEDNVLGHVDGTSLSVIRGIMRGTVRSTNTTGVTGVQVVRVRGETRYKVRITYQRKEHNLGTFSRLEDAAAARKAAEKEYFDEALKKPQK